MKSKKLLLVGLILITAFSVTSCAATVPQEDYDAAVSDYNDALAEIEDLEESHEIALTEKDNRIAELETELTDAQAEINKLESDLTTANQETVDVQQEIDDLTTSADNAKKYAQIGYMIWSTTSAETTEEGESFLLLANSLVDESDDETLQNAYHTFLDTGNTDYFIELYDHIFSMILFFTAGIY